MRRIMVLAVLALALAASAAAKEPAHGKVSLRRATRALRPFPAPRAWP
jgi:hypothetical protein